MDIRNTRQLKDFSAGRLANAREGQKIILYFSLITIAVSAVATVVSYILSQQIAKTGGLGSMGVRSALTTAQMLLPIVRDAGVPRHHAPHCPGTVRFPQRDATGL